ncbi:MAG TPA: bifunctional DNA-formamidopyrimidine glycosylase/DNA-(apurinic or apyrimidinic site) lyase [Dongiaceae bacterium]|nr:bifunctional DNA-formamidopyrimidine glycosylase/DNA-(apurinic or apyrimidinic site) lyase [Dongiaceae bacterium]
MPELPEVEVLCRSLGPLLKNKTVREVRVRRPKVLAPTRPRQLAKALVEGRFLEVSRRGKYLLFTVQTAAQAAPVLVVGHLGMTGRMYLRRAGMPLPRHTALVLELGREQFIFEDTRYFGRFTLDAGALERLGPEPLGEDFTLEYFAQALKRSSQAVKVKLLDQRLVAGIGNIYASEALFQAGLSPRLPARRLKADQIARLWRAIREVLADAIEWGSTVPLNYPGTGRRDGLFYFGSAGGTGHFKIERLRVYDRAGAPCPGCGTVVKRLVQAGRSTYYCPVCQRR